MGNQERKLERVSKSTGVSEDDLSIAITLDEEGKEVPESLKPALEAYKAQDGGVPNKKDEHASIENDGAPAGSQDDEPENKPKPKEEVQKPPKNEDGEGESDDEGEEGKAKVVPQTKRPIKTIPLKKHLDSKKEWDDEKEKLVKEIDTLKTSHVEDSAKKFDEKLKAVADKTGMDMEDLRELVNLSTESVQQVIDTKLQAPPAVQQSEEEKETEFWKKQDDAFNIDFATAVSKFKDKDPEMEKHKDEIKDLFFMEGHTDESIYEIWTLHVKPTTTVKKKSIEGPGDFNGGNDSEMDWAEIAKDPEKIANLTLAQKEQMTDFLGKQSHRTIRHPGR